jgi:hypothetical protein
MAWTDSKVFQQFLEDCVLNDLAFDLTADTFKAALYNNSITPDNDTGDTNTAYNAGQWANTNEVTEVGQWAAGGVSLASTSVNIATADVVFWDANDTASGSAADLANVYGCLVYDDTLSDRGVCYNYFGGANSVVNGTFTVVWSANGIWRATL